MNAAKYRVIGETDWTACDAEILDPREAAEACAVAEWEMAGEEIDPVRVEVVDEAGGTTRWTVTPVICPEALLEDDQC